MVAGSSENNNNKDFVLIRLLANGDIDNSFDTDGVVTTAVGTGNDIAYAISLQLDGKIILTGSSFNGSNDDFAVVRYETDGSLDTTFDNDGKLTTAIGTGIDTAKSIAVQLDEKIVVAGSSFNGINYDFSLARYNPNGSLDTSFNVNGKVITSIGLGNDKANSLIIDTIGSILVAGVSHNSANSDFALVKYTTEGNLDINFDADGIVTTSIGTGDDIGNAITKSKDGNIIVVGGSIIDNDFDYSVVSILKMEV